MKKTTRIIAMIVLAASCAKTQTPSDLVPADAVRISASTFLTKVALNQTDGRIAAAWENGDRIGVFCSAFPAGNYSYTASTPSGTYSDVADFLATEKNRIYTFVPESEFYAYYPYGQDRKGSADALEFSLPQVQNQNLSSPVNSIRGYELFVSKPCRVIDKDNPWVRLDFKPLFPVVQLNLKLSAGDGFVPMSKVVLKSDGPLAGAGTLDITSADVPVSVTSASNDVILNLDNLYVTEYSSSPLYAVVLPGSFKDIKLEVTALDNSTCTIPLNPATLEAGHNYVLDIDLKISDFVEAAPFNVTAQSLSCSAGSSIDFVLSGEAATVDFWSGEQMHDYAHAGEERFEYQPLMTSFYRSISAGNQADNTRVMVSTDFNGKATEADILKATWTDISEHFDMLLDNKYILGDANPVTTNLETYNQYMHYSGEYDIAPYAGGADAIYFAWFYHVEPYDAELDNSRTRVQVTRLSIGSRAGMETGDKFFMTKANLSTVEGASYDGETTHCSWQTPKNDVPKFDSWRFSSNIRPTSERNAYAFTKTPISVDKKNLGTVTPLPVKTAVESTPKSYSYKFEQAGTYKAVFVATKYNLYGETVEAKFEFTITVN